MKAKDTKRVTAALQSLGALKNEKSALKRLDHIRQAREAVDALELAAADAARDAGHTWMEIGKVYGLTKQGAQQRFRRD